MWFRGTLRHGITVFRNTPDMTLNQVVADSNQKDPTIHFAIHSNASTGKARVRCSVISMAARENDWQGLSMLN